MNTDPGLEPDIQGRWRLSLLLWIARSGLADAEVLLERHAVDIILLDLGLPDVQGLDAVRRARAAAPRLPLVVLTGLDDEEIAGQALQEGAQDYIIKGQVDLRGLLRALRYAVERKSMEDTARDLALQIAHTAKHDDLTGLPNRVLLNDRIDSAIALAGRHKTKLAVLFLDLDGFRAESTLVTAIINMAHTLGLRVVAEGVETEEELQFIKDRGCDEGQGYYFSRPLASSRFAERLAEQDGTVAASCSPPVRIRSQAPSTQSFGTSPGGARKGKAKLTAIQGLVPSHGW